LKSVEVPRENRREGNSPREGPSGFVEHFPYLVLPFWGGGGAPEGPGEPRVRMPRPPRGGMITSRRPVPADLARRATRLKIGTLCFHGSPISRSAQATKHHEQEQI
jgi:hypothetical protein